MTKVALDLVNTPYLDLDDDYVVDNPDMKKAIKNIKKQVCGACLSVNCILKQMISKKLKMHKIETNFGCKGSPKVKFAALLPKEIRTVQTEATPPVEDPQSTTPSSSVAAEAVSRFLEIIDGEEEAEGPAVSSLAAGFKIKRPQITKDCLPTPADIHRYGTSKDKSCVICLKPNLSMRTLDIHITSVHNIVIGDPLKAWLHAAKVWDDFLVTNPDYNSENEEAVTSEVESEAETIRPNKNRITLAPPKNRKKKSKNSSKLGKGEEEVSTATEEPACEVHKELMSLGRKISDLSAAQAKYQADSSVNSARILEMSNIQERSIATSAVNTSGLLEIRKIYNKSLDKLTSGLETLKKGPSRVEQKNTYKF